MINILDSMDTFILTLGDTKFNVLRIEFDINDILLLIVHRFCLIGPMRLIRNALRGKRQIELQSTLL